MTEIDEIIVELDRVYKMTTENKAWLRGRLENLARVNKRLADPVVDARNDPPEMPREDIKHPAFVMLSEGWEHPPSDSGRS